MSDFEYDKAFSRNIGWLTTSEQQVLRNTKVAIAGAGGVGSEHLVTLARLGIGKFSIADFDEYEVHNFNRQAGAFMSTVGQKKALVMDSVARDINPEVKVDTFNCAIDASNVDAFLQDVDIYVDSLDFFAMAARELVFKKCEEKGIPVVTAAPLGMGCAFLCFTHDSMSFSDYFQFDQCATENEKLLKFLIGLSPSMLQMNYLVVKEAADFQQRKGPSTPMAVKLCAGIAATNVLKIILKRGKVIKAPSGLHFDAYRNKFKTTWRPWGNKNPIQRLMFKIAKKAVFHGK